MTKDEQKFLTRHGIPSFKLFDTTGLSRSQWMQRMSKEKKWVAYGPSVAICQNGHRLRLRSGHCFPCKPAGISYLRRHDENGCVYIAYSKRQQLVKVGYSKSVHSRMGSLNDQYYGEACDWRLVDYLESQYAGSIESMVQKRLFAHRVQDRIYFKGGELVSCSELFNCSKKVAQKALEQVGQEVGLKN